MSLVQTATVSTPTKAPTNENYRNSRPSTPVPYTPANSTNSTPEFDMDNLDTTFEYDTLKFDHASIIPGSITSTPRIACGSLKHEERSYLALSTSPVEPDSHPINPQRPVHNNFDELEFDFSENSKMPPAITTPPHNSSLPEPQSISALGDNHLPSEYLVPPQGDPESHILGIISERFNSAVNTEQFIHMWGQVTHREIIAKFATQRDMFALNGELITLFTELHTDIQSFCNKYYQLREALTALLRPDRAFYLNLPSFFETSSGISDTTYKSLMSHLSSNDPDMPWNERQLVNSFMTLLRSSPGFISRAISELSGEELASFLDNQTNGPFNVFFHGILGSSEHNRPRVLAMILQSQLNSTQRTTLLNTCFTAYTNLAIQRFSNSSVSILEKAIQRRLSDPSLDMEPIVYACIQHEQRMFLHCVLNDKDNNYDSAVTLYLKNFVQILFTHPQLVGVLPNVYVANLPLSEFHKSITDQTYTSLINKLKFCQFPELKADSIWNKNEYIVLRGSDIILLFKSLLPYHCKIKPQDEDAIPSPHSGEDDTSSTESVSEDGDWCLESIRLDLSPVINELSVHVQQCDGWQVFKVDEEEGLLTDLNPSLDMDSISISQLQPESKTFCDVLTKFDGSRFADKLEQAKLEASLKSDFVLMHALEDVSWKQGDKIYAEIDQIASGVNSQQHELQTIQQIVAYQRFEQQEAILSMISTLDRLRLLVWFEVEVRSSALYLKSKELLGELVSSSSLAAQAYTPSSSHSHGGTPASSANSVINPAAKEDSEGSNCSPSEYRMRSPSVSSASSHSRKKYNRRSFLGSYSSVESPFISKKILPYAKLNDKEVDFTINFMKRNSIKNFLPSEEIYLRGLSEICNLSHKIRDSDNFASYLAFKKDRYHSASAKESANPSGSRYRPTASKSSTSSFAQGLFNFFDSDHQPSQPLLLHTTPSAQVLNMSKSDPTLDTNHLPTSTSQLTHTKPFSSPPKPPICLIQSLLFSDLGMDMIYYGTETDRYLNSTGSMLLNGDTPAIYLALIKEISTSLTPEAKLHALEQLVQYMELDLTKKFGVPPSREQISQGLSRTIGRSPGTIFGDLQIISHFIPPSILTRNQAFDDIFLAAQYFMQSLVRRSIEYATRLSNYIEETLPHSTAITAGSGIVDTFHIWSFCAKFGDYSAQSKLVELYQRYKHIPLEIMPLSRPSSMLASTSSNNRRMVISHWLAQMDYCET